MYKWMEKAKAIEAQLKHKSRSIYLAGKISEGDWRCSIVRGLRELQVYDAQCQLTDWPRLTRSIFDKFDYAGPYFTAQGEMRDLRMLSHGALQMDSQGHGCIESGTVVRRCLSAVDACDLVFAWMSDRDQYGTLVEIGYAAARGKPIYLGWPSIQSDYPDYLEGIDHDLEADMWFPSSLAGAKDISALTPEDGLRKTLAHIGYLYGLESPLEEAFWSAWQDSYTDLELTPQHSVLGKYRLDFAHLPTRTAIECDGVTYHGSDKSFESDRRRDRELTAEGWATVRFTGDDIRSNVSRCVREVMGIIQSRTSNVNAERLLNVDEAF